MSLRRVGVVGCGLMGSGIAEVAAVAGHDVRVREIDDDALARGVERLERSLRRAVERGKLEQEAATAARRRVAGTTDLTEMADRELVIEAVTEDRQIKLDTFRELDEICPAATVFASNTSSLSVTEMAATTGRPERVLGLHFFNPVPAMALVEVVHTLLSDEAVVQTGREFVESLGKTAVLVRDRTGFLVNRLLVPYLLDAIRLFDEDLATAEDIDRAMKLGAGYPMGPLRLLDVVGLDTALSIAEIMHEEYREPRYAPPPLLRRMVLAGRLGRKSGHGFYDYTKRGEA